MNESEKTVSQDLRTPMTEAKSALLVAGDFFIELANKVKADYPAQALADPELFFHDNILKEAFGLSATNKDKKKYDDKITCEYELTEVMSSLSSIFGEHDGISISILLIMMHVVIAHAVQAINAKIIDKHEQAWAFASDARYHAGLLQAAWLHFKYLENGNAKIGEKHSKNPAAELAKLRHAENYAMTEEALKYWQENIDPNISASKAANELLKVVPFSHKKLAEIVAAAKKNHRR